MRWSRLYTPTLRENPADADTAGHRLLVRAGYVRQLAPGHYALLPLAVRVREKMIGIIREEMARIGGQEFVLPALYPESGTGRRDAMGPEIFRLRDRRGTDLTVGAAHAEVFAALAQELSSYRELPQVWYGFRTGFRDELRPKGGLLRLREFTMLDSCSLHVDQAGLGEAFERRLAAGTRIFSRLGVPVIPVQTTGGAAGGGSRAFMCLSDAGEDLIVRCVACEYAADADAARSVPVPVDDGEGLSAPEPFDTPDVRTIDDLVRRYGVAADRQIKTLVYVLDDRLTLVLVRGDHSLAERRLLDATGAETARAADPEEISKALGASAGSLGAVGVSGLPIVADAALRGRRAMTTGANRDGVHLRGVDVERDIAVGIWGDLREVRAGEQCPDCGGPLETAPAIAVGRVGPLDPAFAGGLGVLGPDGDRVTPVMVGHRVGVERALAAAVQTHHDDKGIVWPIAIAPFEVAVVLLNADDEPTVRAAEDIHARLSADRLDVVLDDRDMRPGAKFKDVELVGIPVRVTVGRRGLSAGTVEITVRATGETVAVPVDEAAAYVRNLVVAARG